MGPVGKQKPRQFHTAGLILKRAEATFSVAIDAYFIWARALFLIYKTQTQTSSALTRLT
jgi:hypothetical protein